MLVDKQEVVIRLNDLHPQVSVITGDHGSGKTAALLDLAREAKLLSRPVALYSSDRPDTVEDLVRHWRLWPAGSGHNADERLSRVGAAIGIVLKPLGWEALEWDSHLRTLTMRSVKEGRKQVQTLSGGTRSLLGLAGSIATLPTLKLSAGQPLVLIDEVELHLHPRLQQQVLGSLVEAFPAIQFVVTTNSPQVVSTVPKDCVHILRADAWGRICRFRPLWSPLARSVEAVLPDIFDTSPRPDHLPIATVLHRYEQHVRRGREEEDTARDLKRQLVEADVHIPPEDLELWRMLARHPKEKE